MSDSGKKFSQLFYNPISYLGALLTLIMFLIECFLFGVNLITHEENLYLGLVTYLLVPPFLIGGLLLIPLGALWKKRNVAAGKTQLSPKPLIIDLSRPSNRNTVIATVVVLFLFTAMSLLGAYKSFHYTESISFCGKLCHRVMAPEYTAYLESPHSRVKCVDCHIGSGADWYVRSKLSGARQVLKAVMGTYQRPVPTPVHNLRPARETCEQCHWPGKFFGTLDLKRAYFLSEKDNPRWDLRMLLSVGGGDHQSDGVHSHMNIKYKIYYVADEKRQKMLWVKSVDKSGGGTVFTPPDSPYKNAEPPAASVRMMDCVDCHNQPSHRFIPPTRLVDDAMQYGVLDPTLPSLKEKAVDLLSKKYSSSKKANQSIREEIETFYKTKFPEIYSSRRSKILECAGHLVNLYNHNMFPDMKTRWDVRPNNIGHFISDGCFRCHDGQHRSPDGRTILKDCRSCHLIVEQGPHGATEKSLDGLEFKHPADIGDVWKESLCTECHTA